MTNLIKQIAGDLQKQIEVFEPELNISDIGTVAEAGDGIARVHGLASVRAQELVQFSNGVMGTAFNLEKDSVGVIIMGDYGGIAEGMTVRATGRISSVPVGDALIGRVVNALGEPIDGKGPIATTGFRPIERIAPGVVYRQDVDTPVQTGIKSIDAMIPVGRGQRELIIGDRQTGKTAIAIDTIINQKGQNLICIYVAIGQKKAAVARTVGILERNGAMEHTIIVVAAADESAALQYIAPYSGCAIGEEFLETGRDALIIYDDLSKHAWAYRQVSLLLRRPPGREAYPGDVFYLHSRLLERAARLDEEHGGGSLTALPIIETQANDVSAYIPTNVISITDGQIILEADLFYKGTRPAINVGISVSRVGGNAQTKAMKKVAGKLRLDLSQYRDLEAFAQFGSELDPETQRSLARGERLVEMLNQKERKPLSVADQVASIYSGTGGYLDRIQTDRVQEFLERLLSGLHSESGDLMKRINESGELSDEDEKALGDAIAEAIDDFGPNFDEEGKPLEEGESDRVRDHREEEEESEDKGDGDGESETDEESEPEREEVPA